MPEIGHLTDLELATAFLPGGASTPLPEGSPDPLSALEATIRPHLEHPPCVVSFSGGVDSSIVLSVAARVARSEGLPPPVPVSLRFPNAPDTFESTWQEAVVAGLGLADWERLEFTDELEVVGPVAQEHLRRNGVRFPANLHIHAPVLERARGGVVLTGFDGDGVLGNWPYGELFRPWPRPWRPSRRQVMLGVQALLRPRSRRVLVDGVQEGEYPWLAVEARAELDRAVRRERASEPAAWLQRVQWVSGRRYIHEVTSSFDALAAGSGARVAHPLVAPAFLASLGRARPIRGWPNRATLTRDIFAGVLGAPVFGRREKAAFNEPLWGDHTRSFVRSIDSRELPDVVDPGRWRRFLDSADMFRAALLVQHVWLRRDRSGAG